MVPPAPEGLTLVHPGSKLSPGINCKSEGFLGCSTGSKDWIQTAGDSWKLGGVLERSPFAGTLLAGSSPPALGSCWPERDLPSGLSPLLPASLLGALVHVGNAHPNKQLSRSPAAEPCFPVHSPQPVGLPRVPGGWTQAGLQSRTLPLPRQCRAHGWQLLCPASPMQLLRSLQHGLLGPSSHWLLLGRSPLCKCCCDQMCPCSRNTCSHARQHPWLKNI